MELRKLCESVHMAPLYRYSEFRLISVKNEENILSTTILYWR